MVCCVTDPPDSVEITGFNKSIAVRMDTTRKMTCTSNEGNPRPSLTWYTGWCCVYRSLYCD